jgi:rubrerythrin
MKRWLAAVAVVGLVGAVAMAQEAKPAGIGQVVKAGYQESLNAKAEYTAFAAKADEEGYKAVSALFRAAAESEGIHIRKFKAAAKEAKLALKAEEAKPEAKTTKENLEKMIKDKTALTETTHPAAVKAAQAEKNEKVAMAFMGAMAANAEYIKYAQEAAKNLDGWKAGKVFYVCDVCSFVMTDPNLAKCPICQTPRSKFDAFGK